jgi:hypothetical protein
MEQPLPLSEAYSLMLEDADECLEAGIERERRYQLRQDAAKGKYPKEATMRKHLTALNWKRGQEELWIPPVKSE